MGGSEKKKKDKKKKRKRQREEHGSASEDEEYARYKQEFSKSDRRQKYNEPITEEFDYDYHGQQQRASPPKQQKCDLTPPPPPPALDWSTKDHERKRDRDYQHEVDSKLQSKIQEDSRRKESATAAAASSTSQGKSESLSIEETNKLRTKLGLKPLQVGDSSEKGAEKSYEDRDDVHKPAGNISTERGSDKMREKMEAIREKRKINKKLHKVKGLAEDDDPVLDSAAAWVAKSRKLDKEKEQAAKRAKMLEEMDEEFGVSGLIEETVSVKKEQKYTSKDLKGLKVQHKGASFQEGGDVILTLKDQEILADDNEDVLTNVNMEEMDQAKKNVYNRTNKPGYKGYDEVDEETGMLRVRGVLDKYDEEIDGEKKQTFTLGEKGEGDIEGELSIEKIRENLKAQQVSLESSSTTQLARDFFTEKEMATFKRPRKKVRKVVRKRTVIKADDLLKLDLDSVKDRGTRKLKSAMKNSTTNTEVEDMDIVPTLPDELDFFIAVKQVEEDDTPLEDDEAEQELQMALHRSRMSKVKQEGGDAEKRLEILANKLKKKKVDGETPLPTTTKSKKKKGAIVLDSTSEFCRTLGELPTNGVDNSRNKQHHEEEPEPEIAMEMESEDKGGWEQVEMTQSEEKEEKEEEVADEDVLDPEPIPKGMASTIMLANMKGYLKEGKGKVRKFDPLNLPKTKAEVDVEKLRDEEKGKYSGRRRDDRDDRYDPYSFKEKTDYKPNVKIEYVDGDGRELSQKEAFRLLSHKFHGKASGKLKTEKRANKVKDEKKLQFMSSIDTPLNTSAMFKEKQKNSATPFIVLSGGGKNLLSSRELKK